MSCTVIRNGVIFTVDEQDQVYRDSTVVVRGDRIAAVGSSDQVGILADASRIIKMDGKMALIPGLTPACCEGLRKIISSWIGCPVTNWNTVLSPKLMLTMRLCSAIWRL